VNDEPEASFYGHITSVVLAGYGVWCLLTGKIAGRGSFVSPVSFRVTVVWGVGFISAGLFLWTRYFWARVLSSAWALNVSAVLEVVFLIGTIVCLGLAMYWLVIVPVQ